uniref:Putative membrane protein n=1 Tax=Bradyrhizobium sp. HWK12 TaxID=244563 RepID=E2RV67_9BRAD|nr:putative membrane protein [Bradyrhizobium sp. HWK12]
MHLAMNILVPPLFLLMWSSGAIFVKLGLMSSSVWTFLAVRSTGATLVLALVLAIGFRSDFHAALMLPRRTIFRAVSVGLLLQAGYQGAYFLAIANQLSPGVLTIILGAQPLLMPWVARESVPWAGKALLLAGFFGLVLAVMGTRELGDGSLLGLIFGVVALVAITAGTALQKRIDLPVAHSILWQYIGSVLCFWRDPFEDRMAGHAGHQFPGLRRMDDIGGIRRRERAAALHAVEVSGLENRHHVLLRADHYHVRGTPFLRNHAEYANRHRRRDHRGVLTGVCRTRSPAAVSDTAVLAATSQNSRLGDRFTGPASRRASAAHGTRYLSITSRSGS